MKMLLFFITLSLVPGVALAALHTQVVQYKDEATTLEGYLSYQEGLRGRVPGVLIVPDWMGLSDHYRKIADKLAEQGYIAFAADMYGKGVRPSGPGEAANFAHKYKSDRQLMRRRILAGFHELQKQKHVDPTRIGAIGYCFGGTVVLELARGGADVRGVVSFHGGLDTPHPEDAKNIKGKVLVLHGADDPFVPPNQVAAFQDEMRKGGVDWEMVFYGNAVHAFTTRTAGTDKSKGAAYDEQADKRSWDAMKAFFREVFQVPAKK